MSKKKKKKTAKAIKEKGYNVVCPSRMNTLLPFTGTEPLTHTEGSKKEHPSTQLVVALYTETCPV
jgi:hypothetical protein